MSRLYGPQHRELQDSFNSRAKADRVEMIAAKTEIDDLARAFIESRPTVSYKGGDPGFVRVLDANTIVFPSYDGNGMYYSVGNITANPEIGCLFIDFEKPFRLRLQGKAELVKDGPLVDLFTEAEMVVKVTATDVWMNCPRYVHRYKKENASRYVPRSGIDTPVCEWKRIDGLQDILSPTELSAVEKAGHISQEEWMGHVLAGDDKA
jgi:uncharacterized protein